MPSDEIILQPDDEDLPSSDASPAPMDEEEVDSPGEADFDDEGGQAEISFIDKEPDPEQGPQSNPADAIEQLRMEMTAQIETLRAQINNPKSGLMEELTDLENTVYEQGELINSPGDSPQIPPDNEPLLGNKVIFGKISSGTLNQWTVSNGSLVAFSGGVASVSLLTDNSLVFAVPIPDKDNKYKYVQVNGGSSTIRVKSVGASSNSGGYNVVSAKTWDGATLGATAFNVIVATPMASGVDFFATKVGTNTPTGDSYIEQILGTTGSETQIGDSIEGSDTADTVTADSGSTNQAVKEWDSGRGEYNDAGDQTLYDFRRLKYINSRGIGPWKITGETKVTVDVPESCGSTGGGSA